MKADPEQNANDKSVSVEVLQSHHGPTALPRKRRRGLLSSMTLLPEREKADDYSRLEKWIMTVVVAIAAAPAPMGASIFYPALSAISVDFDISKTVVNLSVAFYILSMAIFPIWWSSLSQMYGRRSIYLISFLLNTLFAFAGGWSTSIGMLIAFRILAGGASASVQAIGAGTLADIWSPQERGRAMGIFYLGPLLGPLPVPIAGGALVEAFGWRSAMWFLAAMGAVVFVIVVLALPETIARKDEVAATAPGHRPAKSTTRVFPLREWPKIFILNPLKIILYLKFFPVALVVYYAAITFASLYVLNISVEAAFGGAPYNYSSLQIGLLYVPSSLGYVFASLLGGPWVDRIMVRAAVKAQRYDENGKLIYLPEDRMRENCWIAASAYPATLIWYGWTVQFPQHWAVPSAAMLLYGATSMLIFSATTTMLTEFMPHNSSGGVALNNLIRNIFSCVGFIIGQPLIDSIGHGWLMTAVGLLAWVSGNLCIWLLSRNSRKWRIQMDEAMKNME